MATMPDYVFFMHDDAPTIDPSAWEAYLRTLRQKGVFEGGSEIGGGICMRKGGEAPDITEHLAGYIRIVAATLDEAKSLLTGNPHFEAGGTVEIRELPQT